MMTSSNGNIFRVTGHLCGEFTGRRWIPRKGQWRGALMFSLICTRINGWVNTGEAGELIRHRAHYDVTVMKLSANTSKDTHGDVGANDENNSLQMVRNQTVHVVHPLHRNSTHDTQNHVTSALVCMRVIRQGPWALHVTTSSSQTGTHWTPGAPFTTMALL